MFEDVRELTGHEIEQACGPIDLVAGGVPCQPASVAGRRRGVDDERWLWPDFLRIVREVSPRWVLAENPLGIAREDTTVSNPTPPSPLPRSW